MSDIQQVINFDMSKTVEDYVHRIGRTGRAGLKGESHTFITSVDAGVMKPLIRLLRKSNLDVDPELYEVAEMAGKFCNKMIIIISVDTIDQKLEL